LVNAFRLLCFALPAVAGALATIAAFFGRWSWRADLLANFRPQYAALLGLLALVLAAGRWWKTALLAALAATINLVLVAILFMPTASPPEATLRILTFNVFASNQRFGEVVEYLRRQRPDVVFLHEASRPWEVAMENSGLDYLVTVTREPGIFGTLVLSDPAARVTSSGFATDDPRSVEVLLADGTSILAIHPVAPASEERARLRDDQLGLAAEWAAAHPQTALVVGDFNATPWSYPFRKLIAESGYKNSMGGFGLQTTYPTDAGAWLRIPIDHLVHSPDFGVVDRRVGPPMGSDHRPLVVDLAPNH
jgi:endonuclease/exonuclease/phosphatase (EEP) superfamily protein YafD